jgi:hypothetical protein
MPKSFLASIATSIITINQKDLMHTMQKSQPLQTHDYN